MPLTHVAQTPKLSGWKEHGNSLVVAFFKKGKLPGRMIGLLIPWDAVMNYLSAEFEHPSCLGAAQTCMEGTQREFGLIATHLPISLLELWLEKKVKKCSVSHTE